MQKDPGRQFTWSRNQLTVSLTNIRRHHWNAPGIRCNLDGRKDVMHATSKHDHYMAPRQSRLPNWATSTPSIRVVWVGVAHTDSLDLSGQVTQILVQTHLDVFLQANKELLLIDDH